MSNNLFVLLLVISSNSDDFIAGIALGRPGRLPMVAVSIIAAGSGISLIAGMTGGSLLAQLLPGGLSGLLAGVLFAVLSLAMVISGPDSVMLKTN